MLTRLVHGKMFNDIELSKKGKEEKCLACRRSCLPCKAFSEGSLVLLWTRSKKSVVQNMY